MVLVASHFGILGQTAIYGSKRVYESKLVSGGAFVPADLPGQPFRPVRRTSSAPALLSVSVHFRVAATASPSLASSGGRGLPPTVSRGWGESLETSGPGLREATMRRNTRSENEHGPSLFAGGRDRLFPRPPVRRPAPVASARRWPTAAAGIHSRQDGWSRFVAGTHSAGTRSKRRRPRPSACPFRMGRSGQFAHFLESRGLTDGHRRFRLERLPR